MFSAFLAMVFSLVSNYLAQGRFNYWETGMTSLKANLRSAELTSTGSIPESGYYEVVYYAKSDCRSPQQKVIIELNTCAPSWSFPGDYAQIGVQADAQMHTYSVQLNAYSDANCAQLLTSDAKTENILICNPYGSGTYLTHVIPEPLWPQYDNLDYTIGIYKSQSDCTSNGFSGLLDIEYAKFGVCVGYNGYDLKITSCTAEGLVGYSYTSQNFMCNGNATAFTLTSSSVCQASDSNIVSVYQGYANFVCAPGR